MANLVFSSIRSASEDIDDFVVFTVEPPWSACRELLRSKPKQTFMVDSVEYATLESYVGRVAQCRYVLGLGGGKSLDAAKYVAMRKGIPLILVPTVLSVDAYLSRAAAVRKAGAVLLIGDVEPEKIIVDSTIIRRAPPRLNRAGAADVYASKISLMDWRVARDRANEEFDEGTVREVEGILARLKSSSGQIRGVTARGVRALVHLHSDLLSIQGPYSAKKKPWPGQGIEHIFSYSLESVTRRPFTHGEIVGAGCVVATMIHGGDAREVVEDLDSLGLRFRPEDYDVSRLDFAHALSSMKRTVKASGYKYLALDDFKFTTAEVGRMWEMLSKRGTEGEDQNGWA